MPESLFNPLTLRAASASFRACFRRVYGERFTDYLTFVNRILSDPQFSPSMRRSFIDEFEQRMAHVDAVLRDEEQKAKPARPHTKKDE